MPRHNQYSRQPSVESQTNPSPAGPPPTYILYLPFIIILLIIAGCFFTLKHIQPLGVITFLAAMGLQLFKSFWKPSAIQVMAPVSTPVTTPVKTPAQSPREPSSKLHKPNKLPKASVVAPALPSPSTPFFTPGKSFLFLFLFWLGFSLIQLTFPSFSQQFPLIKHLPLQQSFLMLFVFWLGLIVMFRNIPDSEAAGDLTSQQAHWILFLLIVVGVFIRYYHGADPSAAFWDDEACEVIDPRRMRDLGDYRDGFIFPYEGCREPFYTYFMLFLWKFVPSFTSLEILRLMGVILDTLTIWLLYLLGKEAVNRRTGIWAAALGAISKALIVKALVGIHIMTPSLGIALALLFSLRLFKRPNLSHFIQWGIAVAFGIYTYSTFRPMVLYMLGATFLWVFWKNLKVTTTQGSKTLVLATGILFFVYILFNNNAFPENNWIARTIEISWFWMPALVLTGYLLFALRTFLKMTPEDKGSSWFGWLVGSWICVLLSFPIMSNPLLTTRLSTFSPNFMTSSYLKGSWDLISPAFKIMFWEGRDRPDLSMPFSSVFGYLEVILIALGLAYFLARIDWKKTFILMAAFVGVFPYFMTTGAHTGRMIACFVPLLLVGAIGFERLLRCVEAYRVKGLKVGLLVLMSILFVWSAQSDIAQIYAPWYFHDLNLHGAARVQTLKDQAAGDQVFVTLSFGGLTGPILYEEHPVLFWKNTNNIYYQRPKNKLTDAVVIMARDEKTVKELLTSTFPEARWSGLSTPDQPPGDEPRAWRCLIPLSEMSPGRLSQLRFTDYTNPQPLQIRDIIEPCWKREFCNSYGGFSFGVLDWTDYVSDANAAVPADFNVANESVRYTGNIQIHNAGRYKLVLNTDGTTVVRIDGKKVLSVKYPFTHKYTAPPKVLDDSIRLSQGPHSIEVVSFLQRTSTAPGITLTNKDTPKDTRSLWSGFDF